DLTLQDAEEIASSLTYELDPHADVIWGARVNSEFEGRVRVMAVMTGVKSAQILGTHRAYEPVTQRSSASVGRRMARDDDPSGHLIDFL
ncbi:MAG TPA: cell division protein FtsZ, partial [Methanoculleus thermophilus]|nr:cell division protein FtsZ [Methanoculleus thermophilus]